MILLSGAVFIFSVIFCVKYAASNLASQAVNNESLPAVEFEQALLEKLFKNYNKKLRPGNTLS
jgi:hypothetical protein